MASPSKRDQWAGGSVSGLNREQAHPWASLDESLSQRIHESLDQQICVSASNLILAGVET